MLCTKNSAKLLTTQCVKILTMYLYFKMIMNTSWIFNIVAHPYYRESTQAEKRSRTTTVSLHANTSNVEIQMHNNAAPFQSCADVESDRNNCIRSKTTTLRKERKAEDEVAALTGENSFSGRVSQVQGRLAVGVADVGIGVVLEQNCAGETQAVS